MALILHMALVILLTMCGGLGVASGLLAMWLKSNPTELPRYVADGHVRYVTTIQSPEVLTVAGIIAIANALIYIRVYGRD